MPLRLRGVLLIVLLTALLGWQMSALQKNAPRAEEATPDIRQMLREINARNIENTVRKLVSFGTRNTLSAQDDPKRGIGAARDWLYSEFQTIAATSGGRMTVEQHAFEQPASPRIPRPTRLTNVVAMLNGERHKPEDRVYIVSAHYDSMASSPTDAVTDAPGANDDASGCAAVLEMARVMATRRFDAPIVFMCVAGEEQGLLGATRFAEDVKQRGWNVAAMFTNDIIGNSTGQNGVKDYRSVRVFSEGVASSETNAEAVTRRSVGGENDSPSRQLARYIKEVGEKQVRGFHVNLIYRRDRYGRGGDHIPFLERGVPAVRFTEPNEDYRRQHQNVRTEEGVEYGDVPDKVDFRYVAQVARVNAAALAELALAPSSPKNVVVVNRLSPDTTLRWTASTETDIAGYEVVWRDTTAPIWTHSQNIGNATTFTLTGMSKDNFFFGVRAVDRFGHKSPVSYPRP